MHLKKLVWLRSSRKDLIQFPIEVRKAVGYALYVAQLGETHNSVKFFKGYGAGIYEIISNYNTNTYRVIYTIEIEGCVYVLHSFQKKSKSGIKTPREELIIIKERLKYLRFLFNPR